MKLPVLQFVPVVPCPVAADHWKESCFIYLALALKICINTNEIQPSLPQAEQYEVSQPFLIQKMLRVLNYPCGPLLNSFKKISIFLELGTSVLDTIFQMWPQQGRVNSEVQAESQIFVLNIRFKKSTSISFLYFVYREKM